MKFAYCGFDFFDQCLRACLEEGHELVGAFCQKVDGKYNSDVNVRSLCAVSGVTLRVGKVRTEDIHDLASKGCNLLVSAAYAHRIPAKELQIAGIKGINIHPSLLPEGRGPWPLPHVILKGLSKSGVTFHKLTDEFDAGEILLQDSFEVTPTENLETLSCKIQMLAPSLLVSLLRNLDRFWNDGRQQGHGTYWGMPTEHERSIDWTKPVSHIKRVVRAFGKFESWANFDGRDWLVQEADVWESKHPWPVGKVVHRTNREVVVAALDGFVCLRFFEPEPEKV